MTVFDPLDGWFEKGFRIRAQKAATVRRDKIRFGSGGSSKSEGVRFSPGAKAKNATSVIKRAPEVMVKITGSSSGLATVKHHIDYISRNGDVELIDEQGETIKGREALKALREHMKAEQIPLEGKKREFVHVLFSMPPGTPEKGMRDAVLKFCGEEFANRRWVAALHNDTDHAHVHVCVGTRDIERADEPRLNPRKADLARWRQGFADKLRENGIDAAASERRNRFQYQRAENGVVRQIRADNPKSAVFNQRRATEKAQSRTMRAAQRPDSAFVGPLRGPRTPKVMERQASELKAAIAAGQRPDNPHADKIEKTRQSTLATWAEVAKNLDQAGEIDLVKHLASLMREGEKPARSRAQELYDLAQSSREKSKDQGNNLER
mgnify:CR=1 FL=1